MEPRLVVTGMGLTTSLAAGVEANWTALRAGRTGLRPLAELDGVCGDLGVGGPAPPLPGLADALDRRDRAHAYLEGACREALSSAGLEGGFPAPERAAVVLGSSLAAQASARDFWESTLAHGPRGADYRALRSYDTELRLAALCATFGARGESLLVSNACAAGASALALAGDLLRLRRADLVLVAGYDALDLHTQAGFGAIKALAPKAVLPFASERAGMQLGDGFAAFVLEREAEARAAGRRPVARLCGYGESSDAHHLTQPHPEGAGAALAMRRALDLAGLDPGAIDAINAHATATQSNDPAEVSALRAVFGKRLAEIPLMATKPAVGHTLGGAGAVEAVVSILALRDQLLPPTATAGDLDPACAPLDLVRALRPARLRYVLSNSFGFGGCNASLVLGAPE
ncbi:MAG: beta-ketoacyl-[acyl-carrier-protein] synthase family protein [Planctomycetota bacterium]|nr:MAG: beta-ketoacyl-[acyl-carrier-protein] synthase family protein [Planctomycetota bacterium]